MMIKNLFIITKNYMRYFTCAFACLCTLLSWAQRGQLFNTDNQLSSNLVTQVYQDTNGFIWITTRNGINVYDGYNFTVIKKSTDDKRGLNTNYIFYLCTQESSNVVWLTGVKVYY